jgi:choice-of-anchor B domain-containing protein
MRHLIFCAIALLAMLNCTDSSSNSGEEEVYTPPVPPSFECVDGLSAGTYPCSNIDLIAHVDTSALRVSQSVSGVSINDMWAWMDPATSKKYALIGLTNGVTFVDITTPNEPIVVGFLPESSVSNKIFNSNQFEACTYGIGERIQYSNATQASVWRDMKVFNNYMYVVSDGQSHGLQYFDLTKLRNYDGSFITFEQDGVYTNIQNAHNIAINEETGFGYIFGVTNADQCVVRNSETNKVEQSGIYIVDLNSSNPVFAGCYFDSQIDKYSNPNIAPDYIHDGQCINYSGPDSKYSGKEVCFNSAEGAIAIVDVSDKTNPQTIGFSGQSTIHYSHQGWLTEDQDYFIMNDETDEINLGRNTKTYIWDITSLEDPQFVGFYDHSTSSIDHNLYIKGDFIYQSNYNSGLRILEIGNLSTASLSEVAYFDTHPENNGSTFDGAWSNYPFFDDIVLVSDINRGLFILKPNLN